jgi:hypothetical protein
MRIVVPSEREESSHLMRDPSSQISSLGRNDILFSCTLFIKLVQHTYSCDQFTVYITEYVVCHSERMRGIFSLYTHHRSNFLGKGFRAAQSPTYILAVIGRNDYCFGYPLLQIRIPNARIHIRQRKKDISENSDMSLLLSF